MSRFLLSRGIAHYVIDVLGTLVKLSEADRPFGIQAEVLRSVQNMVVLLDEQFLVHSAVHKAVLRLLRNCVGDDIQEQLDGKNRAMGAAGNAVRTQPSEYEEDREWPPFVVWYRITSDSLESVVNLLCILCSRIRNYRDLLMIFFHDKQWYRSEPLFSVEEEDEEEDEFDEEEDEDDDSADHTIGANSQNAVSTTGRTSPSQDTNASALTSSVTTKKPEYEFLLFNYLLRFVHREGQIGDFARAGLLFLMDVAMSPGEPPMQSSNSGTLSSSTSTSSVPENDASVDAALALAEYILDGDFSEVLAAGLAAVYSLLPSKLEITSSLKTETAPGTAMVLGSSGVELSEDQKEKLEIEREKYRAMGVEDSSSPDFKCRLDHFLKLIEFLQDVFRRNVVPDSPNASLDPSTLVGTAIVQSILDAVRRVFLENVLYPSILECSDSDGSAVAVMSYIDILIRTIESQQLGETLVDFLMSEDNTEDFTKSRMRPQALLNLNAPPVSRSGPVDKSSRLRRRKSTAMVLLEMEAPGTRRQSEYFTSMGRFTLKDLLLSSLKSTSTPTITAALQLLQSMFQSHCKICVDKLITVIPDPFATSFPQPATLSPPAEITPALPSIDDDDEETFVYPGAEDTTEPPTNSTTSFSYLFAQPDTTYWTHEREMGLYLTLVSRVDPNHNEDAFSTGYEHYLRDALLSIQSQECYRWDVDMETRAKSKHRLNPNDAVLSLVLESLRRFFSNTPELNMALTGVLAMLAICPDRSLAGWLTFLPKESDPNTSKLEEGFETPTFTDGDDRSIDFGIEKNLSSESHFLPASSFDEQSRPVVHTIFHGLVSQLERYRQLVENFDKYLLERRQGLIFSENLTDALTLALDMDTSPTTRVSSSTSSVTFVEPPAPKPKPKQRSTSSFVSFLTPKKIRSKPPPPETQTVPQTHKKVEASPFGPHYQKTGSIVLEPFLAPAPSSGPWSPAKPRKFTAEEEDVFSSSNQWGERTEEPQEEEHEEERTPSTVTLSRLLDNVVILEESIKELVAIIHARRSLGIDSIRYL